PAHSPELPEVASQLLIFSSPGTALPDPHPFPTRRSSDLDAGETVASFANNITIALGNNPGGASLSGTRTVRAVNGVATFSDLSRAEAQRADIQVATESGLSSAT